MNIQIYIKPTCPYCKKALLVLNRKKVLYETIDLTAEPGRKAEMVQKAGGATTVPQIFIKGHHVGGCDQLVALENAGKLDKLIGLLP